MPWSIVGTNIEPPNIQMGVPKAPIFVGLSLINHPFEGTPTLGNPHMSNHLKTETVHPFPY